MAVCEGDVIWAEERDKLPTVNALYITGSITFKFPLLFLSKWKDGGFSEILLGVGQLRSGFHRDLSLCKSGGFLMLKAKVLGE